MVPSKDCKIEEATRLLSVTAIHLGGYRISIYRVLEESVLFLFKNL